MKVVKKRLPLSQRETLENGLPANSYGGESGSSAAM
jgi:hypothetical protein